MMRSTPAMAGIVVILTSALSACQNDFDKPTFINHPMLLGAHVEVVGDPLRATPAPGENVRLQLALVGPRGSYKPENVSSMVIVCKYPNRFTGIPICQEFLDLASLSPDELMALFGDLYVDPSEVRLPCDGNVSAEALGVTLNCITGPPELEVPVPVSKDAEPGDLLLRGVVCTKGQAVFDPALPELFGCDGADDKDALTFHSRLHVAIEGVARNDNPDVAALKLTINGRAFDSKPDPSIPKRDCAGYAELGGPILIDPYDHLLGFEVPASAREKLPSGDRETWEFTVYATAGDVLRRFTLLSDADAAELGDPIQKTVTWNGGGLVDYGESRLVDFWITVRDQRGGFVVLPRSACVELPDPL